MINASYHTELRYRGTNTDYFAYRVHKFLDGARFQGSADPLLTRQCIITKPVDEDRLKPKPTIKHLQQSIYINQNALIIFIMTRNIKQFFFSFSQQFNLFYYQENYSN